MAKKTIEQLFKENGEDIKIQVVCIQCPTDPHGVYYFDEEYSFSGSQEDYKLFVADYFDYGEIDEEFIFYRPFADPDISILYLKDW